MCVRTSTGSSAKMIAKSWRLNTDGNECILNWPNHLDIHVQHYSILNKRCRMPNTAKDQLVASFGRMEMGLVRKTRVYDLNLTRKGTSASSFSHDISTMGYILSVKKIGERKELQKRKLRGPYRISAPISPQP